MCEKEYVITSIKMKEWGICRQTLLKYIKENKIPDALKSGNQWYLPKDCKKPLDRRFKKNKSKEI